MILSASGWRKVFAESGNQDDTSADIGVSNRVIASYAASVFYDYLKKKTLKKSPAVVIGMDTRPTGNAIVDAMLLTLISKKAVVKYIGVTAAPEIMAYSRFYDGFIYVSASHNPVGHNGIKFGLSDGGVLEGKENAQLVEEFQRLCDECNVPEDVNASLEKYRGEDLDWICTESISTKKEALSIYRNFSLEVISSLTNVQLREMFFKTLDSLIAKNPIGVVCDMNGSARTLSIDRDFFAEHSINFYPFNNIPGDIVHEIIPEPENLVHVAKRMEELQQEGKTDAVLGYMPDCDGDRGNIVYWDHKARKAKILKAQEVFSLSVLSELCFTYWLSNGAQASRIGVAVNCPTSMRINDIAECLGAKVYRAEVGEANVVNLARKIRKTGSTVRILGEGSNGGTITYPSSVRDPLNTIFAFIKLLTIKDSMDAKGNVKKGLFHIWCEKSGQEEKYSENFTLSDVIETLPVYTTTGVSEERALTHINLKDHAKLKRNFQNAFEASWNKDSEGLKAKYNITGYEAVITNGTEETRNVTDFSLSGKGGLKILFYENGSNRPSSYIWMRGSGTEPVFRVMCDVKGNNPQKEAELLEWETKLLGISDITL